MRLLTLLSLGFCLASAHAQSGAPSPTPLPPPETPPGLIGSWSTARTETRNNILTIIDPIGANSITAPGWLRLESGSGFFMEGSQSSDARLPKQEPVVTSFTIGVDLNPPPGGGGSQTFIWLVGFCELRYESESSRLSFIVWQAHGAPAGDSRRAKFTRVDRPLVPGSWNRVVAEIAGDKMRLRVNDSVVELPLPSDWELSPPRAPVLLGNSGDGTRPFYGRFNHLYFASNP
jgi:hypothetical protein